ncbi:response regulator transcription factor [Hydrogenovibrio thermophilus]|uniref:Response regulator n=1 Tax=Hydrogenovibrio thermophilus TaxID=265883 RepID=A0A410H174_9GAMM|nr:response regulator [Hydrogenovibrio thermophilus]QAB14271.1 response regulator [Hydrogenovibrio thermophilus]
MNETIDILIVDDDSAFLTTLTRMMQRQGHPIHAADTVSAAQDLIDTTRFSRAILDLNLQGDSGLKLLTYLVERQPACRVVILTGYASIATTVEAMKHGACDYLCKPASLTDILKSLELDGDETETEVEEADPIPSAHYDTMSPKRIEWEHIQRTLMEHDGNISATARALNMHRRTLQRKLQKKPVHK